jgi:hypothetical protein
MTDLNQAKLDLWDIDDFINKIQEESDLLKQRYHQKLSKLEHSNNDLNIYFKSIGANSGYLSTKLFPYVCARLSHVSQGFTVCVAKVPNFSKFFQLSNFFGTIRASPVFLEPGF